jgi:pSer/pThr/pTyr-binding forkhead associated (FHA) protein
MCDVSVARTDECLRLGKEALERHRSYRKISRKHFRICLIGPDQLEIEDLSTNGTLVNGHRVDKIVIAGFQTAGRAVEIEFGAGELIVLTPGIAEGLDASKLAASRPTMEDSRSHWDRTPVP